MYCYGCKTEPCLDRDNDGRYFCMDCGSADIKKIKAEIRKISVNGDNRIELLSINGEKLDWPIKIGYW